MVSGGVREVRAGSVVTSDGREHPAEVIIFGTGFHVTDPPIADAPARTRRADLAECWNGTPHTYLGVTVTNFPNLFRLGGAGSATGHNSHVFHEECQVAYAMDALRLMRSRGIASVEVRAAEQRASTRRTTRRGWRAQSGRSAAARAGTRTPTAWPRSSAPASTREYRRAVRRFDPAPYALRTTAAATAAQ